MRFFPRMHPRPRPGISLRLFLVAAGTWCLAGRLSSGAVPPPPVPLPPQLEKAAAALADLRVFLDFDDDTATFASWPLDKFGRKLPPDQIARAVRLALSIWASALPDMRFRFVQSEGDANLCVRFGNYRTSGFGDAGGRAFLPSQWSRLDPACGRRLENRMPDGSACAEWEHNIIAMMDRRWAVKRADFRGNREVYRDFAWIFDPANPHYAMDGRCRDGRDPKAAWSDTCVPFRKSPAFDSLAGADLASIFEHEFGHTLVGDHTYSPYECVEYGRRPILSRDSCVRLYEGGFSVMFPGDGVDGFWNRRGLFEADAKRLRRMGYRVSYPGTAAILVLAGPRGAFLRTSDWREAQKAMIWPLQRKPLSAGQAARQLFLVDVFPADALPAPGKAPP
ncbi:MAG TPA: hypothetical protein VJ385_03245 [Fibrobacteria bacterium]|nr:hypothetical protein [Fibrobacteria bacterium]